MSVLEEDRDVKTILQKTARPSSSDVAKRPILLTIAGFDPSAGAGISADLKVFAAHGAYGMACITALTIQSTLGVGAIEPVSGAIIAATLKMLAEDVTFSGIKLGMLANGEIAEVVNNFLKSLPGTPAVLDPVLRSSSGRDLVDSGGIQTIRKKLLARVDWITPNLDELAELTGTSVAGAEGIPSAAEKLRRQAREIGNERLNIVVTGGHLDPPNDYVLTADGDTYWAPGRHIETTATHGTGCAYSSALLCRLVAGESPHVATSSAKDYVAGALLAAYPVGRGNGPVNHLYGFKREDR